MKFLNLTLLFSTMLLILLSNVNAESPDNKLVLPNKILEDFALRIESSIKNGNTAYFNQCFNSGKLLLNISGKPDTSFFNASEKGFFEGFTHSFDPGNMIMNDITSTGRYNFIGTQLKDNYLTLVFRILNSAGLNYHAYKVEKINNEYQITDLYIFGQINWLSQQIKDNYKTVFQNQHSQTNPFESYTNEELEKVNKLAKKGKFRNAYEAYKNISDTVRFSQSFQVMGIRLASNLDVDTYQQQFEEYSRHLIPNGGSFLVALQGALLCGNTAIAMSCTDSLSKYVLYDPLLDLIRANLNIKTLNYTKAETQLLTVIEVLPSFEQGYIGLLNLYVEQKNYDKATYVLDKITSTFGIYKEDLQSFFKEYPDFYSSTEYQLWLNK